VPPGSAPVFTPGPGYDLLDAYNACQKDDACYDRYINASSGGSFDTQVRKFKDNRGNIRYYARGHNKDGTSFITYGEYPRYQKVNESPPPYCTLTLSYDAEGRLTEAVFKQ
ncbi:MAG: hypothetical protein LBM64_01265, partial [Deltaproteobacteria bacterium]|jgi:hypothetical protein|nr:hypothetical protein [Deltaproteobacteria bacterium]